MGKPILFLMAIWQHLAGCDAEHILRHQLRMMPCYQRNGMVRPGAALTRAIDMPGESARARTDPDNPAIMFPAILCVRHLLTELEYVH